MLEASGGSGPPKARVLWGPIGTDGVNRRAVSPRSVFAHEPRVVFRDNKRATSSSVGNDHDHPSLSSSSLFLFSSLPPSFLPSVIPSSNAFLFHFITRNLFLLSTNEGYSIVEESGNGIGALLRRLRRWPFIGRDRRMRIDRRGGRVSEE